MWAFKALWARSEMGLVFGLSSLGQAQLSSKPKVKGLGPSSCLATCFVGLDLSIKNYQSRAKAYDRLLTRPNTSSPWTCWVSHLNKSPP